MLSKILSFWKTREENLHRLEVVLGYRFKDVNHLNLALIHRSWAAPDDSPLKGKNNERLEFLGDSVLNMLVTQFLYRDFEDRDEGDLSKLKAKIVSGPSLAKAAVTLNLGDFLKVSDAEKKSGGTSKISILEDAFEALIGAMYLDGGIPPCSKLIQESLLDNIEEIRANQDLINYKSKLLELTQGNQLGTPSYTELESEGPEHSKIFTMAVVLNDTVLASGKGSSKKKAEQLACRSALQVQEEWFDKMYSEFHPSVEVEKDEQEIYTNESEEENGAEKHSEEVEVLKVED